MTEKSYIALVRLLVEMWSKRQFWRGLRSEESCRESFCCLREYIHYHEENVTRNINIKGASGEACIGNEEYVVGHWMKGNSCYKVTELYFSVGCKVALVSDKLRYLAEKFSIQSLKDKAWIFLSAYVVNRVR